MPALGIFTPGQRVYFVNGNANGAQTIPQEIRDNARLGDFIGVIIATRLSGDITDFQGGGQTWTRETEISNASASSAVYAWCFFDGTFDNTTVTVTYGNSDNLILGFIWRRNVSQVNPGSPWDDGGVNFNAPSTPFDQARAGQTTNAPLTEVIYAWHSTDDNTWSISADPTAPAAEIYGQQVNQTGSNDMSMFVVGKTVHPSGVGSGTVTARQTALGGDSGGNHVISLRPASFQWLRRQPNPQVFAH